MEVQAVAKYIRMSSRKARLVVDMVRGMEAQAALNMLKFVPKGASEPVSKLIRSAMANAEENYGLSPDALVISEIAADEGPTLKRGRFGARGRFKPILKRSTHLKVVLSSKD
ncbi:MAG: 50S ribosomal protein L22 [Chloroflexi bacterium]|nr:50S ribosomal protein L22 [Chloroflexota bacterium]